MSLAEVQHFVDESLRRACAPSSPPPLTEKQTRRQRMNVAFHEASCRASRRLRRSLDEMGPRLIVPPTTLWQPIEGRSAEEILAKNPDPFGALQRGEVPAIILRNAMTQSSIRALGRRSLRFAQDANATEGSFGIKEPYKSRNRCALGALGLCCCDWRKAPGEVRWRVGNETHRWKNLSATEAFERLMCDAKGLHSCSTEDERELFNRSNAAYRHCLVPNKDHAYFRYSEYGRKLLHVFGLSASSKRLSAFMENAQKAAASMELMAQRAGCVGKHCSPPQALLASLRRLAGPAREVTAAIEPDGKAYVPGVLRVMSTAFAYSEHFDSPHSNAWANLRQGICPGDKSPREVTDFGGINVDSHSPLRKHSFSAATILTLQAPVRKDNPYDLRLYRARWPAFLNNCSVRLSNVHGVGGHFGYVNLTDGKIRTWFEANVIARMDGNEAMMRDTVPVAVREKPVDLIGEPGDLYIFNSEFMHRTPPIVGRRARIVVGGVVGYSQGTPGIEVWS